jgi:multisubunit Na+/H+ antiporter MnhF subunit
VNAWLIAAMVLLFGMVPCGIVALTGEPVRRLVGLEMGGMIVVLEMVLLTEWMNNANFLDLPLCLALLAFGGGLVFVRFLERWL